MKGVFQGQDVFIVAGGPSLIGFDWNRLKGKNIIAINKAMNPLPFAQIIYFSDCRFWDQHKESILNHPAQWKVTPCTRAARNENLFYSPASGYTGLETKFPYIREGKNSGYASINIGYHTRASRIILLGYDMGFKNNNSHWHEGYKEKPNEEKVKRFSKMFWHLKAPLEKAGIEVLNTNLESGLEDFPKINLKEVL